MFFVSPIVITRKPPTSFYQPKDRETIKDSTFSFNTSQLRSSYSIPYLHCHCCVLTLFPKPLHSCLPSLLHPLFFSSLSLSVLSFACSISRLLQPLDMASNHEACDECARTCLLVHKNGENSKAPVPFFFKIMLGAQFSHFLPFPPRFAATVRNLIGQETFLENPGGLRWKVKFSLVDGSLGFKEGWNVFAVDNKIEYGDFVMFNYIQGSHFFVQVCDNTACEKPYSSVSRNQKKGTTTTEKTRTAKNGPRPSVDKGTLKKQGSRRCVTPEPRKRDSKMKGLKKVQEVTEDAMSIETSSEDEFTVEPSYATKRDVAGKSRELQREEFDLPTLERLINKQCNDGSKNLTVGRKKHPKKVVASSKSTRKVGFCDKKIILNVSDSESWEEDYPEERSKLVAGTDKKLRNKEITKPELSTSRWINAKGAENMLKDPNEVLEPEPISIKPPFGSNFPTGCTYNFHRAVKPGATDTVCHPSTSAYKVPCSTEAGGQPFLVLPTSLPFSDKDYKPTQGEKTRRVILRDQYTRLWPVLYDASSPTLMQGWGDFCKANKIQPRDLCTFHIQDGTKNIYEVRIDRS